MMANRRLPGFLRVQVDLRAALLVVLFAVVIGASLWLLPHHPAASTGSAFSDSSGAEKVAGGAAWVVAEVLVAGGLLACILLWGRFPEWLRDAIKSAAKWSIPFLIGGMAARSGALETLWVFSIAVIVLIKTVDAFDVWWVANDLLAVSVAIWAAVGAGIVLGPVVIAVGLVGLSVYDYAFADRKTWMFTLLEWTLRLRLPMLFIIPVSWRLDWDELTEASEATDADGEDGDAEDVESLIRFGIGTADLFLPAAFAVALAHSGGGLPLVGAVAGTLVACARISWKMEVKGAGAGMPPLTSGALAGWAIAFGVGVVA